MSDQPQNSPESPAPGVPPSHTPAAPAPPTPTKVAEILDDSTLVINRGSRSGVQIGHRLMIFGYGKEIVDPDTKLSLGRLEIIRGTGVVTHVQDRIATVKSDMKSSPKKTIKRNDSSFASALLGGMREIEEISEPISIPFEDAKVGDMARRV